MFAWNHFIWFLCLYEFSRDRTIVGCVSFTFSGIFCFQKCKMSGFLMFCKILFCLIVCSNLIGPNSVRCGNSAFFPNDDDQNHRNSTTDSQMTFDSTKILKRDKRYLLFTGGGISKVCAYERDKWNWGFKFHSLIV